MEFKTKFKVSALLYFIHKNIAQCAVVKIVKIECSSLVKEEFKVSYVFDKINRPFKESELFSSADDLILNIIKQAGFYQPFRKIKEFNK
jgi:hypothetical protein